MIPFFVAMSDEVQIAIIAAIPGLVGTLVAWKAGKKRANAAEIIALRGRVEELEVKLHDVTASQEECNRERRQLLRENLDLYRENSELRKVG